MTTATRRPHPLLVLAAIMVAWTSAPPPAVASRDGIVSVQVLVNGVPVPEYRARGTTYVEALRGAEYSVQVTNHGPRRIAVALSVDGLNSIDAKTTTSRQASKWVLGPYETVTVDGWQVSSATARRFFFTTEEHSYGAWLGKTDNLGVIEAVVFREVPPQPVLRYQRDGAAAPESEAAPLEGGRVRRVPIPDCTPDDPAATGIGRRVDNPVHRIHLELEPHPAAHVRIRYEYRPQLVQLGVLPSYHDQSVLHRREHASGFEDFEFAPDPSGDGGW